MADLNSLSSVQSAKTDTSEMDGKYLTFWTDGQLLGVPIAHVVQIVGIQNVTAIPEFPYYAKGIINLRGSIIPLIDVRLRLGKQEVEYNERTCIIVTNINENFVGFIVDEVDAVIVIDDDLIAPPPHMAGVTDGYITGIGKLEEKVVLLMDTRKIVGADELEMFAEAVS
ncbi:MAG: chemotaxis protein CheW [Hydrogenoanaerobacterium sp.]